MSDPKHFVCTMELGIQKKQTNKVIRLPDLIHQIYEINNQNDLFFDGIRKYALKTLFYKLGFLLYVIASKPGERLTLFIGKWSKAASTS